MRERERERDFRLQMVYCTLAIGPYTNPGQIHTHTYIYKIKTSNNNKKVKEN